MIKTISIDKALELKEATFIDTRTPKEFEEDNIPESINKPLFSNNERAIVGTLYKNNQSEAYEKGLEIYNQKVLDFIDEFKKLDSTKPIIIYCWRGGMRSKVITEQIVNIGLDAYQLEGGYKSFRKHVMKYFEDYKLKSKLLVLQGLAGNGKTDLLKNINPSIDLEGIAKHRSSLFGAIGLEPVSQKMFESRLWVKLEELKNEKIIFIEGEAKKIGKINMPMLLFDEMQKAVTIKIETQIENRVKRIVKDYFSHEEDELIKKIISSLKVHLSNAKVEELNAFVDKKDYEPVAKYLLEEYYDSRYEHAINEIKFKYTISNDNQATAIEKLKKIAAKESE